MAKINLQEIKQKTTKNVLFLSLRNIGIQSISTVGFFLLTILLGTAEVGLFAIVAESVGILGYFSDVGLAAALIQKKSEVKKKELQSTFTIQQILQNQFNQRLWSQRVLDFYLSLFFFRYGFSQNHSFSPVGKKA